MQDLMTRKELQLKLNVSKPTIERWEKLGMPVIRIGGIVRYELDKVMNFIALQETVKGITK